jgi:hypothetical protein
MGDIERLMGIELPLVVAGGDEGIRVIGLGLAGRRDEARRALIEMRRTSHIPLFQSWSDYLMAWLDRSLADMAGRAPAFGNLNIQNDPEAIFLQGWLLCDVGSYEDGLARLKSAVAKGYYVVPTLVASRQFNDVRSDPAFQAIVKEAEAGRDQARAAFREAGGERLLGGRASG